MFSILQYPTEEFFLYKRHQPSDAPVTHFDVQSFSYAPVPQPNFAQSGLRAIASTLFSLIHGSASIAPAATPKMIFFDLDQFLEGFFGSFVSREVPGTIPSHTDNEAFRIEINFDVEMTKGHDQIQDGARKTGLLTLNMSPLTSTDLAQPQALRGQPHTPSVEVRIQPISGFLRILPLQPLLPTGDRSAVKTLQRTIEAKNE